MSIAQAIRAYAEKADARNSRADLQRSLEQLRETRRNRATLPVHPDAPDSDVRAIAKERAEWMLDTIAAMPERVTLGWINATVQGMQGRPIQPEAVGTEAQQLQAAINRACCPLWWRRNLRRAQVREREAIAQRAGRVHARGAAYVTNDTATRHRQRQADSRAMLEATTIESADGDTVTLWDAAQAGTANRAIRRGELMTRIRGCEEWATAAGMVGVFTTNTLPSRFHAMHYRGGQNHRFVGDESRPGDGNYGPVQPNTPADGQAWLCKTWARARAAIKRAGLSVFGFRVAEPHHDGAPHWHMLLWTDAESVAALGAILRTQWLKEHPGEPGADEHRIKLEAIDPAKGGAVAYVAKYIAKNLDDEGAAGTEGQRDEWTQDEIEGAEGKAKAARVAAWASAWGIRQFQAIGQPPVTVWRELRRVDAAIAAGSSEAMRAAHAAVNRAGERRADWCGFMVAQGGAMTGRQYRLHLEVEAEERYGRYGPTIAARPVGVTDVQRPGEVCTSDRKEWKPVGTWASAERDAAQTGGFGGVRALCFGVARSAPRVALPWTRVNNCTDRNSAADLMTAGIVGVHREIQLFRTGGGPLKAHHERKHHAFGH